MAVVCSWTSSTAEVGRAAAPGAGESDRGVAVSEHEGTWLRAGRVGAPHGLDGSFRVTFPSLQLLDSASEVLVDGAVRAIERRAGHTGRVILRIAGCSDRTAAEALRGSELLVAREGAPELDEDEWWAEDLEGLTVRDGTRTIGIVRRLLALPSCEVLEVAWDDGHAPELLVPLIGDAVRSVDLHARSIDVDLGFLGEG